MVILGIGFEAFDQDPPDKTTPTLDITVVNPTTALPPEDYDYLAESSQDGAGNTAEKVRPQQQMIEQAPAVVPSEGKPAPTQTITRDDSRHKIEKPAEAEPDKKSEQPSATELANRS
ncbi:MAG: hypothetical protein WBN08_17970, partial [Thiogranum sp.]